MSATSISVCVENLLKGFFPSLDLENFYQQPVCPKVWWVRTYTISAISFYRSLESNHSKCYYSKAYNNPKSSLFLYQPIQSRLQVCVLHLVSPAYKSNGPTILYRMKNFPCHALNQGILLSKSP